MKVKFTLEKRPKKDSISGIKSMSEKSEDEMLFSFVLTKEQLERLLKIEYKGNGGKIINPNKLTGNSGWITGTNKTCGALLENVEDY